MKRELGRLSASWFLGRGERVLHPTCVSAPAGHDRSSGSSPLFFPCFPPRDVLLLSWQTSRASATVSSSSHVQQMHRCVFRSEPVLLCWRRLRDAFERLRRFIAHLRQTRSCLSPQTQDALESITDAQCVSIMLHSRRWKYTGIAETLDVIIQSSVGLVIQSLLRVFTSRGAWIAACFLILSIKTYMNERKKTQCEGPPALKTLQSSLFVSERRKTSISSRLKTLPSPLEDEGRVYGATYHRGGQKIGQMWWDYAGGLC